MAVSTKLRLRAAWFQVHKWLGLLLFLVLIPLGLSGSLLVWDDFADTVVNPARHAVSPGEATLPLDRYIGAARTVLRPGDRIVSIALPDAAGEPVVVAASPAPPPGPVRPGRPPRYMVWLDPPSARILDHANPMNGVLSVLHRFHGSLLVPGVGRKIVGWLGWAMLASSLTGIWLWWPVTGSVRRGFRWKRGPLTSGNLHHQIGLWIAIPLAVLSFTGAYISFPDFFRTLSGEPAQRGGPGGPGGGPGGDPRLARPLDTPRMTPAAVLAAAGGGARMTELRWPTGQSPAWGLTAGRTRLMIDDATGAATPAPPERERGGFARLMRGLHDAHGYNPIWQTLVFLGGVAPAVLGITGVIMWWRTRGWRARAARRRPHTA